MGFKIMSHWKSRGSQGGIGWGNFGNDQSELIFQEEFPALCPKLGIIPKLHPLPLKTLKVLKPTM